MLTRIAAIGSQRIGVVHTKASRATGLVEGIEANYYHATELDSGQE